jgi:transcriptional regulator GlxA family with amidase domain
MLDDIRIITVAKESGPIKSDNGLTLIAERSIADVDSAYILLVPGGLVETLQAAHDTAITAWVKRMDRTTTYTTSVCTGAWILAGSGVLRGQRASTHWYGDTILTRLGAEYDTARVTVSGKYITSAGVSAGMDMGLKLVQLIAGSDYAKAVQLGLHYDPAPPMDYGSPGKCDTATVNMMRGMYDYALREAKLIP